MLGREIRVTLTNTHVHIKRVPHPDALAAVENDAGKGDSRWKIVSLNENEFRCSICGYVFYDGASRNMIEFVCFLIHCAYAAPNVSCSKCHEN